ncbi:MAG: hypothetical protein DBW79_07120, partial [Cryomorphaceae bacterium]
MHRLISILFLSLLISCGDSDSEDQNSNNSDTNNDFPNYVDSNNLRIFARKGVSTTFLNNVGLAYNEMFKA